MDSVHHIWCPLSSQEFQDLPDGAEMTLTIQLHRDGDKSQQIAHPVAHAQESRRLGLLFDWLQTHIAEHHTLETIANRVNMSPRTIQRRFLEATGLTPTQWLLEERVKRVQLALKSSSLSIELIAE